MVQALALLGVDFPCGRYSQPEDNLRDFMLGRKCSPEVHADLSACVNAWLDRKVTRFSTDTFVTNILTDLDMGLPVVLSGTFPGHPVQGKPLGHIVTLVGYDPLEGACIFDPYGNTLNNWRGSGRDVWLSWEQFFTWFKPCGNRSIKWAHRFVWNEGEGWC
jgi:hypothetical protein